MRFRDPTALQMCSAAMLISFSVLNLPQPIRIDECACSSDIPMARSTCDGSPFRVLHVGNTVLPWVCFCGAVIQDLLCRYHHRFSGFDP